MSEFIQIQQRLQLPAGSGLDGKSIGQAILASASQLAGNFPQSELWEITEKFSSARYTVRNPLGRIMRKVQAVGKAADRLKVGQVVIVGYYDRERRRPYIKASGGFADWSGQEPFIPLALWSQYEGSPGLAFFAASDIVDPDASSSTIFGSGATDGSPYFGITVDSDGRLTFAQMLRDSGDTFWEKMRLIDLAIDNTATYTECSIASSPFVNTGNTFINGDRSFTLILNPTERQLFRRNGTRFEEITLSNLEDLALSVASVSQLGFLLVPQFSGHGVSDYYASYPLYGTTYIELSLDYTHKLNAWQTKSAVVNQAKLWSSDIGANLGYSQKKIFSNYLFKPAPCSLDGSVFAAWVSGQKLLSPAVETPEMIAGYRYFTSFPDTLTYRTDISRELKACVLGLNASSGSVAWTHTITVTAAQAIADNGILGPIETYFGTLSGLDFGDNPAATYGGRAVHLGHYTDGFRPFISLITPSSSIAYPDFAYFTQAAITILPKPAINDDNGANNTLPRNILGTLDTLAVFGSYIQPVAGGDVTDDIRQGGKIVRDEEGAFYFAYLKPESYMTPGTAGTVGVSRFDEWRGLLDNTYDAGGTGDNVYHTPGMINCYRRYIRKLSSAGSLLLDVEIAQNLTASWYEETDQVNLSLEPGIDVLGGDSESTWPLADQLWGLYPCGRVVFVILDYHDLGPTFGPACKLEIRSAADLSILHSLELRSAEDVTTTDILDVDSNVRYYAGSRRYQVSGLAASIRTGRKNLGEWALIWISETDITTGTETNRMMRIELDAGDPTLTPTITAPSNYLPANTTAISNGYILTPQVLGSITVINATG